MKACSRGELAERFLSSVGKGMRGMSSIFRKEIERYEITLPQYHLLKLVQGQGSMTVTELGNRLMIAAPTASRMIDSLCAKDLLAKEKDPKDHRVTLVRVTGKSEKLLKRITDLQNEIITEVFKGEDGAELERSIDHLSRIADRWFEAAVKRTKGSAHG